MTVDHPFPVSTTICRMVQTWWGMLFLYPSDLTGSTARTLWDSIPSLLPLDLFPFLTFVLRPRLWVFFTTNKPDLAIVVPTSLTESYVKPLFRLSWTVSQSTPFISFSSVPNESIKVSLVDPSVIPVNGSTPCYTLLIQLSPSSSYNKTCVIYTWDNLKGHLYSLFPTYIPRLWFPFPVNSRPSNPLFHSFF